MKWILLCLLGGCLTAGHAQYNDNSKVNKKALKVYDDAMTLVRDGQLKDAGAMLLEAIRLDSSFADAYLSVAGIYGELNNYAGAVTYYEKARAKAPENFRHYLLSYSINLAGQGRFREALAAVDTFLLNEELPESLVKAGNYRKLAYRFALAYDSAHPARNYVFNPVNLGDSINSRYSEYYPSITIDDSLLVFTRNISGREDFYESNLADSITYGRAHKIDGSINEEPFKGAMNISQDGDWMLFAGRFNQNNFGNFDLYLSQYTPQGWSDAINLGENINTDFVETGPALSPDKSTLYFVSNRPGGFGGRDLYVSYRLKTGGWSPAENMGPDVNTAGDEEAPFVHADNETLYFTSNGLPGYGGTDLFMLRLGKDGHWGKPQNLGYPINTVGNEGSLFITSDGRRAYYAADRMDTRGGLDLYRFELREDLRPAKTLYVKGKVYDAKTGKGLPSGIELIDNNTRQVISALQTDETGRYFLTLAMGHEYTFSVNRKGYLYYNKVYDLAGKLPDSVYQKDIPLQPIALNSSVVFRNIRFESNSAVLQPVSLIELDKLLALLRDNPTVRVQITGYTDNVGKHEANIKLSADRAKAVVQYLAGKGIAITRLTAKGLGETQPVADNRTEAGRSRNRRTEFKIVAL
jgi:outer membrane protein OmpA-like peptidoglycan-associated protein